MIHVFGQLAPLMRREFDSMVLPQSCVGGHAVTLLRGSGSMERFDLDSASSIVNPVDVDTGGKDVGGSAQGVRGEKSSV